MGSILPRPDEPPQKARPERPVDDSIGRGIGVGLLFEIASILAFAAVCAFVSSLSVFIELWGFIPAIVLIPLLMWQAKQGYALTAKGILIVGCIGFLLNGTCDALYLKQGH